MPTPRRFIGAGLALALGATLLLAGCGSDDEAPEPGGSTPTSSEPGSAPASESAAPAELSDNGWVVESYSIEKSALGLFDISAQIKNTEATSRAGTFTLTISKDGEEIVKANGTTLPTEPDSTANVFFLAGKRYVEGPYTVEFEAR